MPVPNVMSDLFTAAASNSPAGSEIVGNPGSVDNYFRAVQSILRVTNATATLASAATTDIGAQLAEFLDITGSASISAFGTTGAGITRTLRFMSGTVVLVHNAVSLILPGGANITPALGDCLTLRSLGAGNWVCTGYLTAFTNPNSIVATSKGSYGVASNLNLSVIAASGAVIITLVGADTSPASASSPILIPVLDPGSGQWALQKLVNTPALTIPSGATLGGIGLQPLRVWVLWVSDGSTSGLAVVNALNLTTLKIFTFSSQIETHDTVAIGTGSDSAQVIYASGILVNVSIQVLGFFEYNAISIAGVWTTPTNIVIYEGSLPLPGAVVQMSYERSSGVATGTTTIPFDDTAPQNTEGTQFMSNILTPVSAANMLRIDHTGNYSYSIGTDMTVAMFRDSGVGCLAAVGTSQSGLQVANVSMTNFKRADAAAATEFKIRAGGSSAGTLTFNGTGGTQVYQGLMASTLVVTEIQG